MLTPEPGRVVGGKYRILHPLGQGGMGAVYAAENLLTLKHAAIKWLHPRLVAIPEASQRLLHEARATARIRHCNVVDIYDVLLENDSVFLVMELLLGEQLASFLATERLAVHEVIALLLPAMRGVAAAHAAGVIHRDIKPDNIFLAREAGISAPVPKIIDFGISRIFEPDGARLTRSGVTMGTPRYVSYEQLRGLRDVDARSDVYAFGVMLYESVVGSPPYRASTFGEQAISFVTTVPQAPRALRPELPEQLDAVIRSAIAKEREQRTPTMEHLIAALEPFAHATAYEVPLPAHQLSRSSRPEGVADPTGTTATLPPTAGSTEPPPVIVRPSPLPPRSLKVWRSRSVQVAALVLVLVALLAFNLWRAPRIESGAARGAASMRAAGRLPQAPRTSSDLTDRPISPPNAPPVAPDVAANPGAANHSRESAADPVAPMSARQTRAGRSSKSAGDSRVATTARPGKGALGDEEALRARADASIAAGAEDPRERGADPARRADEARAKPQEPADDGVHRAGRLQRTEF